MNASLGRRAAVLVRTLAIVAVPAALPGVAPLPARATVEPALSAHALLPHVFDPVAASAALPDGVRVTQFSSHDRQGGNVDGGSYEDAAASQQPPTYLRRDGSGFVLLDERRPGCLVRMWFTASGGDVTSWGRIQLFFDGEHAPRLDVPAVDLFGGKVPGLPQPLVGDRTISSGGDYSYVPFCFARSLTVRVSQAPPLSFFGWYQLTVLEAPEGTAVETFDPHTFDATPAVAGLGRVSSSLTAQPAREMTQYR